LNGQDRGEEAFAGGYYWFPTPAPGGFGWTIATCRDLGCRADDGHDAVLWPRLIVRLAALWAKDAEILGRRLALSYTGLPRGRVTRPGGGFLILHGDDSPVAGWLDQVVGRFRLAGSKFRPLFDEHETMIPGHPRAVAAALGLHPREAGVRAPDDPVDRSDGPR